ncbi:MAG: YibE/F family protein [Candidatus Pacebacteria bacterium]|nr:YibE/F family protein [Candidatus Paceibacterota bacterium]
MKKAFYLILLLSVTFFSLNVFAFAQTETADELSREETFEASIEKILEEKQIKLPGSEGFQLYQKLELLVTRGSFKGQKITVENGDLPMANLVKYKIGDRVMVSSSRDFEGRRIFYITDFIRRNVLLWLFLVFVIMAVVIGRWQGVTSLAGMAISFLIIFKFILPRIYAGSDPVLIAVLGSLVIIPATFLLSHGINRKTGIAVTGTIISLVITGVLAGFFVNASRLTGFASEEAGFLQAYKPGVINIKGLLLAGIIIGVLGVLDDITISQSAIVQQLNIANPKLKPGELYQRAMKVGRDHIASMVNTLILVYTGAALPLLLLFLDSSHSFSEVVNYEIIADEVVRTLVGSIGLVLAVPITTLIAVFAFNQKRR